MRRSVRLFKDVGQGEEPDERGGAPTGGGSLGPTPKGNNGSTTRRPMMWPTKDCSRGSVANCTCNWHKRADGGACCVHQMENSK
jgi:hypothetical protein